MAQVTIDVKVNGDALAQIKHLRENLKANVGEFLEEVAQETAIEADKHYMAFAGDGNVNYDTEGYSTGELSAVTEATGEDVLFLEYGAGDLTISPYHPGDWSKSAKGSGQYAKHGGWFYNEEYYKGIPPARGMYYGGKFAHDYIRKHGKEVFDK